MSKYIESTKDIDFSECGLQALEVAIREEAYPPINMFFVPCYSIQNGYYSNELNIWYDDKEVIHGIDCYEV